jgi:hypothetical protein
MNLILSLRLERRPLQTEWKSESYIKNDGQSVSLTWNKAPIWGLWLDFYYCQIVAGLLMWGALSDGRMGLPSTIATGPHQRSHFRERVPFDSWSYYTVWDSTLPFLPPPKTRRVTVEVFEPASTQVWRNERFRMHCLFINCTRTKCRTPNSKFLLLLSVITVAIQSVAVDTVFQQLKKKTTATVRLALSATTWQYFHVSSTTKKKKTWSKDKSQVYW